MRVVSLLITAVATVGLLAACSSAPVESAPFEEPTAEAVLETLGEGLSASAFLDRAPDSVRLSSGQRQQLEVIHAAFRADNAADWRALEAIVGRAMEAQQRRADVAAVRGILMEALPVLLRLRPAFAALQEEVNAVLTDTQRAWLREHARQLGPRLPTLPLRRG